MKPRIQAVSMKLPRTGRPQAELIREGLELRLARAGQVTPGAVLDLVGGLAGSLSAPRDLGSSPKHLRGFGR
jgi:hypothetical protein